jgi:hypothetical protein
MGSIFTRNGAIEFLSPDHLKTACFFVLLSNPLTKDEFHSIGSHFGSCCRFSSQGHNQNRREDLQQTVLISTPPVGRCGSPVAVAVTIAVFGFFLGSSHHLAPRKLGIKSKKELKNVIRADGNRRIELLGSHPGSA